jgi:hypothetical protein
VATASGVNTGANTMYTGAKRKVLEWSFTICLAVSGMNQNRFANFTIYIMRMGPLRKLGGLILLL